METYAQAEAEHLLPKLDDSNTISSYKNELAARSIRLLLDELKRTQDEVGRLRANRDRTIEYLNERSWSNGVAPRAIKFLRGEL